MNDAEQSHNLNEDSDSPSMSDRALRKERDFSAAVLDTAGSLIIVLDCEGRVVRFNRVCEQVSGYSFDEVNGRNILDIVLSPEDGEGARSAFQALCAGHFPNKHENFWVARDGTKRLISWSNTALLDESGEVEYIVGTGIEVTEARQAEVDLHRMEEQLRIVTENARVGLVILNRDRRYIFANSAYAEIFNLPSSDLIGLRPSDMYPEMYEDQIRPQLDLAFKGQRVSYELRRPTSEGERFFAVRYEPTQAHGELAVVAVITDITEHRRAEDALRESAARMGGIVNAAMDAIITIGAEQRIALYNPAAERMFGHPADTVIGQPIEILIPQRFRPNHADQVRRFGESGTTSRKMGALGVLNGLRADGEEFPIEASISHIDVAGQKLYTVILRDITESKTTEEALRASEERYRSTLDNMVEGSQLIGFDWRYLYVNRVASEHGRHAPEELLGRRIQEVFPGIEDSPLFAGLARCMEQRVPEEFDNEFQYPDGTSAIFHVIAQPASEGIFILTLDITERKRAEEAQSRLAAIVESSEDAIVSRNLDGRITSWNRGAENLYGYSSADMLGQPMTRLFPPELLDEEQRVVGRLARGGSFQHFETVRVRMGGERIAVSLSGAPLLSESGEIVGISTISRDISQQKRAAQELRESLSLLEATLEAAAEAIVVVNSAGQVTHCNQKYLDIWGVGREVLDLPIEERMAIYADALASDVETEKALAAELNADKEALAHDVVHFRDGRVFERHSQPQKVDGQSIGRVWSFRDVTEPYRHEAMQAELNRQLEVQRQLLDGILANVPGIVWENQVDPATGSQKTIYVNGYIETMLGYRPQEWLSSDDFWLSLVHPADRETTLRAVADMVEQREDRTFVYRILARDGRVVWTESHCAVLSNRQKEVVGLYGVTMDITDRVRAQEEQSRLAALLESTSDFVARISVEGVLQYVNPAGRAMLGLAPEEPVEGRPFGDFKPAWAYDIVLNTAFPAAAETGSWSGEAALLARDGHEIPVSQVVTAHRNTDGEMLYYSTIARDISDRKAIEAALQRYNDELEERVSARTEELAASNVELEAKIAERQMAVGALREVVAELEVSQTQTEKANAALRANEAHLLQGNQTFTELARYHVTTRDELILLLRRLTEAGCQLLNTERCSVWLYETTGEVGITCMDLFERSKGAHSEGIRLSAMEFPAYFEALQSGSVVVNDAHQHPATKELSASYLKPLGIGAVLDVAVTGSGQVSGAVCYEHVGGPREWKGQDQTFARASAAIFALALEGYERARTSEALRQATEEAQLARSEAETANRAKSEFLSRMSHELRTPLNAILGFGQVLTKEELSVRAQESLGYILSGGKHLLNLINEVLDIARVEAGRMELSLEPIALTDIVPYACNMMRTLAAERHIHLRENSQDLKECYVQADQQRLKQVLINLLSNAIKYNRDGGSVDVICHPAGDKCISIAVTDTGPGMASADMEKLFTPFERLNASMSDVEGTGLGLVLSRSLVEAMGGSLAVQSTVGEGTTFTITLPQVIPNEILMASSPDPAEDLSQADLSEHTGTILCIEDNPSNLRLVEILLEERPHIKFLTAIQGSIGLDLARRHEPDLILLDLNLPDMNGKDVLQRLRQSALTRDIPVVVVSADATPSQIEKLMAEGARDYLTKPFQINRFLSLLDKYLPQTPKPNL